MPDPKKAPLLRPTDAPLDEEAPRVGVARPGHCVADALPSKDGAGLARAHAPLRFTAAHAPLTRALASWSAASDDAHGARFDSVGASILVYDRPSWRDRCEYDSRSPAREGDGSIRSPPP